MQALPVIAAPRVPSSPDAQFRCEHFRCTLLGRICLERQAAVRMVNGEGQRRVARPATQFGMCTSGACAQGAEVRAVLPGYVPGANKDSSFRRQQRVIAARKEEKKVNALLRAAVERRDREQQIADVDQADAARMALLNNVVHAKCGNCGKRINADKNKSGYCSRTPECFNLGRKITRPRKHAPPALVAAPTNMTSPAAPAEGLEMPFKSKLDAMTDDQVRSALAQHGSANLMLKALGLGRGAVLARLEKMGIEIPVGKRVRPERSVVPPGPTPTQIAHAGGADEAARILEQLLAHHRGESQKIERALAALRI